MPLIIPQIIREFQKILLDDYGLRVSKNANKIKVFLDILRRCWTYKWCRGAESNRGPTDYESVALPTELPRQ